MKLTKELIKLMQEYNASDLGELMDILPDLDFEEEDDLPQQEADLADILSYKELAVPEKVTYSAIPYPFNN